MGNQSKLPRLLLTMPLSPPYSGPETYTEMLLASPLSERLHIIHLDTSNKISNVARGRLDWQNSIITLKNLFRLLWLLWQERPDLAYMLMPANRFGFIKFTSFVVPCAWSGLPVVSSFQGSHFDEFYQREAPWMQVLIRYALRHIDAVVLLADRLRYSFEPFLPSEKLWTVYIGLNERIFDGVPMNGRRKTGMNVLYVGHLSKAKGTLDLLEAIPLVLSDHPDVCFQFAGEILERERNISFIDNPDDIEAVVYNLMDREGVRDSVELLGIVKGESKTKLYSESEILVLPSYAEGFPWVVLEAMLAGKAVVASQVGALPEVFEHERHLLFVEPGDVEGIAKAINRLIEDTELRERLGRSARQIVQQQFNLGILADRMETVFKSVLESEKP